MKLIIDIPEEVYKATSILDVKYEDTVQIPLEVIANGIPLESIKAEVFAIPQIDSDGHNNNWYREPQAIINDILQIIDKRIGGE